MFQKNNGAKKLRRRKTSAEPEDYLILLIMSLSCASLRPGEMLSENEKSPSSHMASCQLPTLPFNVTLGVFDAELCVSA